MKETCLVKLMLVQLFRAIPEKKLGKAGYCKSAKLFD